MASRSTATRDVPNHPDRATQEPSRPLEPQPDRERIGPALRFVVHKHRARRLHWDVRLEHDGVLWSWAVPKGPSLDPAHRRLAIRVEDHRLDYAQFQGTIPEGSYGAGTVEIWDEGTWEPLDDAEAGLASGEMKFHLAGVRLCGGFVLVRMRARRREQAETWLLIKEHDGAERIGVDAEALETMPMLHPGPAAAGPAVAGRVDAAVVDRTKP